MKWKHLQQPTVYRSQSDFLLIHFLKIPLHCKEGIEVTSCNDWPNTTLTKDDLPRSDTFSFEQHLVPLILWVRKEGNSASTSNWQFNMRRFRASDSSADNDGELSSAFASRRVSVANREVAKATWVDSTWYMTLKGVENLNWSQFGGTGHGAWRKAVLHRTDTVNVGAELRTDSRHQMMNFLIRLNMHQFGNRNAQRVTELCKVVTNKINNLR